MRKEYIRQCQTPDCDGTGYHPASHDKPLKWCLDCLVRIKRDRRHGAKTKAEMRQELASEGAEYQPPTVVDILQGL